MPEAVTRSRPVHNELRRPRRACLAIFLLAHITSPAVAQSTRPIAKRAFSSVVLLLMTDVSGQPVSLGSGFVVRPGVVATNLHVIAGAAGGMAKVVGRESRHRVLGVLATDRARDLALLKIEGLDAPTLKLGDSRTLEVGDPVIAIGNPSGLEGTLSTGIISGIREFGGDTMIQVTAPISPGSSGGPILHEGGAVIGVAVATLRTGQNLNFVIPAQYLQNLLSRQFVLRELKPTPSPATDSSVVSKLGAHLRNAVVVTLQQWSPEYSTTDWHYYSFSVRNTLGEPIANTRVGVVWWSSDNQPVHYAEHRIGASIPPGLALRMRYTSPGVLYRVASRMEVRVLDFELAP